MSKTDRQTGAISLRARFEVAVAFGVMTAGIGMVLLPAWLIAPEWTARKVIPDDEWEGFDR